jgi:toxin ParE1/3/4
MSKVRLTESAVADLESIWAFVAQDSPTQADRFITKVMAALERLGENPGLGPRRPELGPTVHSFVVGNYLVFYRAVPEGTQILRVLHGARQLPDTL